MSQDMSKDTNTEYIYFEGQFVNAVDAKIGVKTHAFLYGTSIFEGIRGYWLPEQNAISIFRMREHYERLLANAKIFTLQSPVSVEEMMRLTKELMLKNQPTTDTYIRPILYVADQKVGPNLVDVHTDFTLWASPMGQYVDLTKGLSVCVSSWRRLDDNMIPPRAKIAGAYVNSALVATDARRMGFDEAVVLTQEGKVSEGSAMNLFIVHNNRLITPSSTDSILEGITRDAIITLARQELGLEVIERPVDRTELYTADEAFFSGTGAQIAPITAFDKRPVGDGKVGPVASKLQELYFDVVKNKLPKYSHWCDVVPLGASVTSAI